MAYWLIKHGEVTNIVQASRWQDACFKQWGLIDADMLILGLGDLVPTPDSVAACDFAKAFKPMILDAGPLVICTTASQALGPAEIGCRLRDIASRVMRSDTLDLAATVAAEADVYRRYVPPAVWTAFSAVVAICLERYKFTVADGLIWHNGKHLSCPDADRLAIANGLPHAEALVGRYDGREFRINIRTNEIM